MVIFVVLVFVIINNASMNNFGNMLFFTGEDIYSGWTLEIGTLSQRVNTFKILLDIAKLLSIGIVPFCTSINHIRVCFFRNRQCEFFRRFHIPLFLPSCSFSFSVQSFMLVAFLRCLLILDCLFILRIGDIKQLVGYGLFIEGFLKWL